MEFTAAKLACGSHLKSSWNSNSREICTHELRKCNYMPLCCTSSFASYKYPISHELNPQNLIWELRKPYLYLWEPNTINSLHFPSHHSQTLGGDYPNHNYHHLLSVVSELDCWEPLELANFQPWRLECATGLGYGSQ